MYQLTINNQPIGQPKTILDALYWRGIFSRRGGCAVGIVATWVGVN